MKKLSYFVALSLGLVAPAFAQVNVVPQVGMISSILKNPSYSATSVALVPAAAATDIFCLNGSATKFVAIRWIIIGGTAGTAITTPFLIHRRTILDTGGTAATSLAAPVPVPLYSGDSAATATAVAYTANPTINDSSPSLMNALTLSLALTTTAAPAEVVREYGTSIDMFHKGLDMQKNAAQQICINLNGATVASGLLNINVGWQEIN